MLLKKFSYLLLAGCISTFAMSCDDEDDTIPEVVDTTDPTATITSPTQEQLDAGFMAGESITVTGTVSDDRDLESVTLSLTAPGETTPWHTMTWQESDFSGNTLQINENIAIPADAAEGTHVLMLAAHDDANNQFSQSWDIKVMAAQEGNVTFNVTVPAGTPAEAQIFVVGSFTPNGWDFADDDEAYMLTKNDDGTYSGTFNLPEEAASEFKFRIKSDDPADNWKFVEKDADCLELAANRTATGSNEMQNLTFTVENWRNVSPCGNE